jgi:hypothetical protein
LHRRHASFCNIPDRFVCACATRVSCGFLLTGFLVSFAVNRILSGIGIRTPTRSQEEVLKVRGLARAICFLHESNTSKHPGYNHRIGAAHRGIRPIIRQLERKLGFERCGKLWLRHNWVRHHRRWNFWNDWFRSVWLA